MTAKRIFVFFCAYTILSSAPLSSLFAQNENDTLAIKDIRGIQFSEEPTQLQHEYKWLQGLTLSVDAAGAVMTLTSPWGQVEGALRVDLKNRYFPVIEAGIGMSNHTSDETDIHFQTHSPYFRIGADYNFLFRKERDNNIFGGLRYGFSPFSFSIDSPPLYNSYYQTTVPFHYDGLKSSAHWLEFVGGVETKIWKNFSLGWSIRYKIRLAQKKTSIGQAWYIPGFGRNKNNVLGGTFNLIFKL